MPVAVSVQFDRAELRALQPGKINRPLVRAVRKAGSKSLRDMRAELSKRVRQRKRIKAKVVRNALRLTRAKGSRIEDMEWKIEVANTFARVSDYPHRQTRRGVSVEINRGQRSLITGAFVATMKSGHRGVFKRRGRASLPIDEQLASRVIDAVSHKGEIEAIHRRGQTTFRRSFDALLPVELAKG